MSDTKENQETYIRPMPDPESSNQRELFFTFENDSLQHKRLAEIPRELSNFFDFFHRMKSELNKELKTNR